VEGGGWGVCVCVCVSDSVLKVRSARKNDGKELTLGSEKRRLDRCLSRDRNWTEKVGEAQTGWVVDNTQRPWRPLPPL
jgi:hypothetical protein